MFRVLFALWKGLTHYRCIKAKKKNAISTLSEVTSAWLKEKKVGVLALDFDGVLSPHGDLEPTPQAQAWLKSLCQHWEASQIVILSNKPKAKRLQFFKTHFPEIAFIKSPRKKPYPQGLQLIAQIKQVPPHSIVLIDDRLLTGMLACCLAGCQGLYFSRPLSGFSKRPITESFFSLLRVFERLLF